ncbi:MAG: hypothetical protein J4F41_00180 [Alphaproteobacteria bacterium]|nr:hypothetical protein [Alphaproteobacteria bacterium]
MAKSPKPRKSDIVKWALLPYQSAWVKDKSPVKVCEKGRRIGISWAEAYDDTLYALEGGGNVYYQTFAVDAARGFINDCEYWLNALRNLSLTAVEVDPIDYLHENTTAEEQLSIKAFRIDLPNGREIVALTSSPRQFRSKGRPGDRAVLDEAAFMNDIDESIKAVLAFTIWGGGVRVISTHDGIDNPFNILIDDIKQGLKKYSHHRIPFSQAEDDGLVERVCHVIESHKTEADRRPVDAAMIAAKSEEIRDIYADNADEELECIPRSRLGAYYDAVLVRAARHPDAGNPGLADPDSLAWVGIDLARKQHQWVASIIQDRQGKTRLVEEVILPDAHIDAQDQAVSGIFTRYNVAQVFADEIGLGEGYIENWKRMRPGQRVNEGRGNQWVSSINGLKITGVRAQGDRRFEMADRLKAYLEAGTLEIPDDRELFNEFSLFRTVKSPAGSVTLQTLENRAGHGDRVWALIFALAAKDDGLVEAVMASGRLDYDELMDHNPDAARALMMEAYNKRRMTPQLPYQKRSRGGATW